jgi:uncharacterized surface protein with fasciclin (FAS1) repeats
MAGFGVLSRIRPDLVKTLQGPGPFTVFAPTDAAFAKLASVPTGDALKDVLLYHVVSGAVGWGTHFAALRVGASVALNGAGHEAMR